MAIGSCIERLYDNNLGAGVDRDTFATVSGIFQSENDLLDWKRSLPVSLFLINRSDVLSAEGYSTPLKLRIILTLRCHNARILAHRPVLDAHLERIVNPGRSDGEILQRIGPSSLSFCIDSARAIVGIVNAASSSNSDRRRLLGAWWFSIYYGMLS